MYKCECGYESNFIDWCDKCEKLLKCDCSKKDYDIREVIYGDDACLEIKVTYCIICHKVFNIEKH